MPDKAKLQFIDLFVIISGIALIQFLTFQFTTNWQWSILMDDIAHLRDYSATAAPDVWKCFQNDLAGYMKSGRLHPVKYVMNLIEYRYLAASPFYPHLLHTVVLIGTLALSAWGIVKRSTLSSDRWKYVLVLVGLGLSQRPLLDIAGLVSIAEPWTAVLLALGLWLFPRSPIGYRLVFLLCAFTKEPAVTVFFASGLVHLKTLLLHREQRYSRAFQMIFDLVVFVALAMLMRHVSQGGSYLAGYNLLDVSNISRFGLGIVKVGLGMIPAVLLILWSMREKNIPWKEWVTGKEREWFCLFFAISYLILVTPRGVPGYLLIPPAFAVWFLFSGLITSLFPRNISNRYVTWGIAVVFLLSSTVSFVRYTRYIGGINEVTSAFHALRMTSNPRMVLSNAMEVSMTSTWLAEDEGVPVQFKSIETGAIWDPKTLLAGFDGDVVLVECTQYFGPLPAEFLAIYENYFGGWTQQSKQRYFKIWYAANKRHP